eukprot:scaffold29963_cov56-Phaeocystis_antarctica.AAC.3
MDACRAPELSWLPATPHTRSGAAGPSCIAIRSSSTSVRVSLPHCLHEMPQYIQTGIGCDMGADFSQIFSIGSSPACTTVRGTHGTPRAGTHTAHVQQCLPRAKLPCASGAYGTQGGRYTQPVRTVRRRVSAQPLASVVRGEEGAVDDRSRAARLVARKRRAVGAGQRHAGARGRRGAPPRREVASLAYICTAPGGAAELAGTANAPSPHSLSPTRAELAEPQRAGRHRSRRPYTRPAMAWRPSPKAVVLFVSFINLVNYVDRGVISGAPNQFNAFILRTLHAETLR